MGAALEAEPCRVCNIHPTTSPLAEEEGGGKALMVESHVQPSKPDLLTYCQLMDDLKWDNL